MKKYLMKGLAVCTFLCTTIAFPSLADICFLPSGICDQEARPADGGEYTCDMLKKEMNLYDHIVEGKNCREVPNSIAGCKLYECYDHMNCQVQGYTEGPTDDKDTLPPGKQGGLWNCNWCLQGSKYWWLCEPILCQEGLTHNQECSDGLEWVKDPDANPSTYGPCGKCEEKVCPEGYKPFKPLSGCYKCDTMYLDAAKTKACYKCHIMDDENYITSAQKDMLGEGCFTFEEIPTDVDPICYLKGDVSCDGTTDQYLKTETLEGGRMKCSCVDCEYEFKAEETAHFTAAGGEKYNSVTSTRSCGGDPEKYAFSVKSTDGECKITEVNVTEGKVKIECPANLTTKEKKTVFTLSQVEKDGATTHYATITATVDPDTCANPNELAAGCNQAGFANYAKGPRPACYQTKFESDCPAGYLRFDDGPKSVAGQVCHYCVDNTCPTEGYTYGEVPTPAEGYLTEQTDVGNSCYKIKPCDEGYSTDYQSANDCGDKKHPQGWIYESKGKSGDKLCGKCTPKVCKGDGFDLKCELQKRCANENDDNCGYKDLSIEGSEEWEGDTPKYNCNIKPCPDNTSTNMQEGCGNNVPVAKSGEETCYRYDEPNRDICTKPDWQYDDTQCNCKCVKECGEGFELDPISCTCTSTCKPGDGSFGSACCSDADCGASDEFPLYCFNVNGEGVCQECATVADCSFEGKPRDRFYTKYGSGVTSYPASEGNRPLPDYSHRDECTNGECIYVQPAPECKATGSAAGHEGQMKGKIGDGCCEDVDCGDDEFPLYCYQMTSNDGQSDFSCRECGTLADCNSHGASMSRFTSKYGTDHYTNRRGRVTKVAMTYNKDKKITETTFTTTDSSGEEYDYVYSTHNYACRFGECTTYAPCPKGKQCKANGGCYTAQYFYDGSKCETARTENVTYNPNSPTLGQNDTCDEGVKDYHSCSNGFIQVGNTEFGTPCYKCN